MQLEWDGNIKFTIRDSANLPHEAIVDLSAIGITDESLNHYALVSTGSAYKVYVNGVERAHTGSNSTGTWFNALEAASDLVWGASDFGTGSSHVGPTAIMDEIFYSDLILTDEEIALLASGADLTNFFSRNQEMSGGIQETSGGVRETDQ